MKDLNDIRVNDKELYISEILNELDRDYSKYEGDVKALSLVKEAKEKLKKEGYSLSYKNNKFSAFMDNNEIIQETIEDINQDLETLKDIASEKQQKLTMSLQEKIYKNKKISDAYLMVGGTFLPAIAAYLMADIVTKGSANKSQIRNIAVGIGLIVGGFATANFLKNYD